MLKVIKFPFRKFSSLLGLSLMVITLFFYKPVYADTITNSNILGINTVLLSKTQNVATTNVWYYMYQHTITLDADYVGTINLDINLSYYSAVSGGSSSVSVASINNKSYFVNGNTIVINQTVTSDNYLNQGPIVSSSYLLKSSNVLKTSTITELQQIIDLLTDIYNSEDQVEGLLNDQLEQLELVVSNTSLANTYLDTISKMHQFNIPFESFTFSFYMLRKQYPLNDIYKIRYYNYPLFNLSANDTLFEFYGNTGTDETYNFILGINKAINNNSQLNTNIGISDGVLNFENLIYSYRENNYRFYIIKISAGQFTSSGQKNIYVNNNSLILPIYANTSSFNNFSTDFALQFGLSNQLLDDLHIIANGTTQSNSSAAENENTNNSLVESQNELFSQEDNFNENMNDSLDQIDTNFSFDSKFGSSFIRSSEWVKTQFDRMTGSTPFGSILGFSLLLGVGLLLIGRVLG